MFFSTIVASAGLLAAFAQAAPSLQKTEKIIHDVVLDDKGRIESFVNATRLGVDIYGDFPTEDAEFIDGHYEADPGTKAHAWLRAQLDIDLETISKRDLEKMEKRQGSGPAQIDFTQWTSDHCQGRVLTWNNVNYNWNYISTENMFSLGVGARSIRGNEHADLSRQSNGNACGQFVTRVVGGPGCATVNVYNCLRFWVE